MKRYIVLFFLLTAWSFAGYGQQKVGDKWTDNNLAFKITEDRIRANGIFTFCIIDTSRGYCIENLSTGIEVKVFNEKDEELWKGIGSGRMKTLKLARALPEAKYLTIKAFKPYVVNKTTGTHIFQEEPIHIKYFIK